MGDREWMYTGRPSVAGITPEWVQKTDAFLDGAFAKAEGASTWCPTGTVKTGNEKQGMS